MQAGSVAACQPPNEATLPELNGAVRSVTLYRDRAQVTREIEIPAGSAIAAFRIANLPSSLIPDSVQAEGDDSLAVRGVRVLARPVGESTHEEIRELDRQIEEMERQVEQVAMSISGTAVDEETIKRIVPLTASLGKSDLERGVLDAQALIEMTEFAMSRRRELADEQLRLTHQLKELEEQLDLLQRNKRLIQSDNSKTSFEATVFLSRAVEEGDRAHVVRLSYLVDRCRWTPAYTVHAGSGDSTFRLRYGALVEQVSGESWNDVRLVLSTASPNVIAARPELDPLRVASADPADIDDEFVADDDDPFAEHGQRDQSAMLEGLVNLLKTRRQSIELEMSGERASPDDRDKALNELAGHLQQVELQANADSWRTVAPDLRDDSASQLYPLDGTVSLASRQEQQLVPILDGELTGTLLHVATPILSSYAWREAELTNTLPVALLQGPASVYLDDRFVGKTEIASTAAGQLLRIGFGTDPQVRVRRELMDKKDQMMGGNRQLTFSYRLVVNNFSDRKVVMRLFDRIPNPRLSEQLSVRFDEPELAISQDGLYQRMQLPTGILRWDLEVPGERHGSNAFDVHYRFNMEFDRNRIPTTEHLLADLQAYLDENGSAGGGFGGGGLGGGVFRR